MKQKSIGICGALALILAAAACEKQSPSSPSESNVSPETTAVTNAVTGITITTPTPVTPTNNQQIRNVEQPLTLVIRNAVSTGTTPLTYTFEVATDAGFASKVYAKEGVPAGANGQTAQRIDKLAGEKNYFWRARVTSGPTGGPNSAARPFTVGPEVVIQAPVLVSPAQNGTASGNPVLIVNNAARTGPAGQIFYRFEMSNAASFNTLVFTSTVAEQGGGQTSVTVPVAPNTPAGTYFWRAQATDPSNAVTSALSAVFSFNYQPFDMRQAIIVDAPPDLGFWTESATITSITFSPEAFLVDFDKRDSPDRWRDLAFGDGGPGTIQYTLGMCLDINHQWYCSAVVQFWHGRELSASTPPSYVARNWFYDSRWGPMQGYQPSNGELVGLFAGTGNLRDKAYPRGACPQICERTNVAIVPWHNDDFATYSFSSATSALSFRRK